MKKEIRQAAIEQLISQEEIANQEELMAALEKQGIKATQATISRDIRELRIVKEQATNGKLHYVIFREDPISEKQQLYANISEMVTEITQVQFLNVVKTLPHNANVLSAILDDLELPQVVGTLAGYDTIVILSQTIEQATKINQIFKEHLQSQD
ncbi:arginine repressor [Liquorilactobacillus vini]|uniref:Arginine repressor n=1 Tax=Liquorilactobacillus vini DSM 20605 TaxID=1133569 RepID=A0A0R2CMS3_9LACO|nr:ArgR family transcriptional regulator [Liquorilactobacillus vini]KRM89755.1 arginine repressor [Liquorilactobacillus vini DSM 20605]